MGFLDDALDKAKDAIADHPDQVSEALDKAGEFASDKTGGKFDGQIEGGLDKAKDALGLDGR
ncbi:antitoxin [Nocardioides nematodiphilus]|uniref:antitoxin n=1 Tax=Nocardioides nematodiphilus TaxID=2849669 RepID=UPI001CDA1DA8|nr:antitoxin [Nocardioides nematodiphilus]MCA1983152.1 antitoxin [Nocardioides nematodiphilus]